MSPQTGKYQTRQRAFQAFECAPEAVEASNDFIATDEWQGESFEMHSVPKQNRMRRAEIKEDQKIPAGIKINMDISTGIWRIP